MRTGLVLAGAAFLMVGATALASIYLVPPGTTTERHDSSTSLGVGPGSLAQSLPMWGENGSAASFVLRWQSSLPVNVSLYAGRVPNCGGPEGCGVGGVVKLWVAATSGAWSSTGDPAYPYVVVARATMNGSGTVTVSATGTATRPATPPALQQVAGSIAAALVLAVGALALFLGVFLRAKPFGPPVEPLRRGPEPP